MAGIDYVWEPSKREFTFQNGGKVYFYTAEEPDSLRGPQHHLAWLDEPAHMPLIDLVWDNLLLGLRLGDRPCVLITSTPTPIKWVKGLVKKDDTIVVRVSTYANLDNLAPTFRKNVIEKYEGTRLGRQELHGEVIEDIEGALWNADLILAAHATDSRTTRACRTTRTSVSPSSASLSASTPRERRPSGRMRPASSSLPALAATSSSSRTQRGSIRPMGGPRRSYRCSRSGMPTESWQRRTMAAIWSAQTCTTRMRTCQSLSSPRGGERSSERNLSSAYTSKAGFKHVGDLALLETEQTEWVPGEGDSPNRIDAEVHGMTNLMKAGGKAEVASGVGRRIPQGPAGAQYTPNPLLGPTPRARRTGIHSL